MEAEPNDSVAEENVIDATPGACSNIKIDGSLGADVDVFALRQAPCSSQMPTASLGKGPRDVRLCLFVACSKGKMGLDPKQPCGDGSTAYRLDEGVQGCCSTSGSVLVNANCDSQFSILQSRPDFIGHVVVDRPEGDPKSCEAYAVTASL